MPKLKVKVKNGVKTVKLDGHQINSPDIIDVKVSGLNVICSILAGGISGNFNSDEVDMELAIPEKVATCIEE